MSETKALTTEELAVVRERAGRAPEAPWYWLGGNTLVVGQGRRPVVLTARNLSTRGPDGILVELDPAGPVGDFLAHSREDVEGLLSTIDGLNDRLARTLNWPAALDAEALQRRVEAFEGACVVSLGFHLTCRVCFSKWSAVEGAPSWHYVGCPMLRPDEQGGPPRPGGIEAPDSAEEE